MTTTEPNKSYSIVILFTDDKRRQYDVSSITISEGCLILVDPANEIPREVRCFPLTSIKTFIFDIVAIDDGAVNVDLK